MKLITGNSHPTLANSLAKKLGIALIDCSAKKFSNTEIEIKIKENVRNEDIYILQTGGFDEINSVNDYLMETLLLIDACKRSGVGSITLIMPCFPYARQDKKDSPRVPISARLVMDLLAVACQYIKFRIVTMDLHAGQILGFCNCTLYNLYGINIVCEYIK